VKTEGWKLIAISDSTSASGANTATFSVGDMEALAITQSSFTCPQASPYAEIARKLLQNLDIISCEGELSLQMRVEDNTGEFCTHAATLEVLEPSIAAGNTAIASVKMYESDDAIDTTHAEPEPLGEPPPDDEQLDEITVDSIGAVASKDEPAIDARGADEITVDGFGKAVSKCEPPLDGEEPDENAADSIGEAAPKGESPPDEEESVAIAVDGTSVEALVSTPTCTVPTATDDPVINNNAIGTSAPDEPVIDNSAIEASAPAPVHANSAKLSLPWLCAFCGFNNEVSLAACVLCDAERKTVVVPTSSARTPARPISARQATHASSTLGTTTAKRTMRGQCSKPG
jgi:hypothetical protein